MHTPFLDFFFHCAANKHGEVKKKCGLCNNSTPPLFFFCWVSRGGTKNTISFVECLSFFFFLLLLSLPGCLAKKMMTMVDSSMLCPPFYIFYFFFLCRMAIKERGRKEGRRDCMEIQSVDGSRITWTSKKQGGTGAFFFFLLCFVCGNLHSWLRAHSAIEMLSP